MPHLAETRKEIFQENGDRVRREIKNTSIRGESRREKTAQKARGGNIAKAVHSGPAERNNSTLKNQEYSAPRVGNGPS